MRLVAVADTHTFHDDLEVPDGDVFVHAGDLCRRGDLDELKGVAGWIHALPHRHKVVVAGNHDWAFAREPAAARALLGPVHYLEDRALTIEGVRFYGSPWQPAFHDWAFNLPRGAALAEVWAKIPLGLDVLITHGPPAGVGDRAFDARGAGCADLRARCDLAAPRLHVFGHIHQDGGVWRIGATTYANVTTWEGCRAPTVFDLDAAQVTTIAAPPHGRTDDDFAALGYPPR
jgi:hypothetical protein